MRRSVVEPNSARQGAAQALAQEFGFRQPLPIAGLDFATATAAALAGIDENHGAKRAVGSRRAPIPAVLPRLDAVGTRYERSILPVAGKGHHRGSGGRLRPADVGVAARGIDEKPRLDEQLAFPAFDGNDPSSGARARRLCLAG